MKAALAYDSPALSCAGWAEESARPPQCQAEGSAVRLDGWMRGSVGGWMDRWMSGCVGEECSQQQGSQFLGIGAGGQDHRQARRLAGQVRRQAAGRQVSGQTEHSGTAQHSVAHHSITWHSALHRTCATLAA